MKKLNDQYNIGSKIQKLMDSRQMTQEEFAEAFFTTARNVRRWLKNGVNKLDLLIEIAKFFEVNLKDILYV